MSDLLLAPRMKMSLTHASNAPLPSTAKLRGTRHAFEPLTPVPVPVPHLLIPRGSAVNVKNYYVGWAYMRYDAFYLQCH